MTNKSNQKEKWYDLNDLEINGYEFTAKLTDQDEELITISGYYNVNWDDDIPMVEVHSCMVEFGNELFEVKLSDDVQYKLEQEIEGCGDQSDWYADRQASLIDEAYDRLGDR